MSTESERSTAALRATDLTVAYGGVRANDCVNLHVGGGEIVGLIGPNGAGKTTFIDGVSGFTRYSGTVEVDGAAVDSLAPHRRRKIGLARTWQAGELFSDLTVAENLSVAQVDAGIRTLFRDLWRRGAPTPDEQVARALAAVGLVDAADRYPTDLSLGEQKLVGVARALVGETKVLLLDEPAAGLDTEETARLVKQLRAIAAGGVSILLVDHDMGLVLEVCHRVYVLDFGKLIASGTPAEISAEQAVVAAYLGSVDQPIGEASS